MEVAHHHKILANIAALEFAGEKVRHEPPNDIATSRDELSDDIIPRLEISRNRHSILLHDGEDMSAMRPLILLDSPNRRFRLRIPHCSRVPNVGKRRGPFGRIRTLKKPDEIRMVEPRLVRLRDTSISSACMLGGRRDLHHVRHGKNSSIPGGNSQSRSKHQTPRNAGSSETEQLKKR